jgi:hypothetical protein
MDKRKAGELLPHSLKPPAPARRPLVAVGVVAQPLVPGGAEGATNAEGSGGTARYRVGGRGSLAPCRSTGRKEFVNAREWF